MCKFRIGVKNFLRKKNYAKNKIEITKKKQTENLTRKIVTVVCFSLAV